MNDEAKKDHAEELRYRCLLKLKDKGGSIVPIDKKSNGEDGKECHKIYYKRWDGTKSVEESLDVPIDPSKAQLLHHDVPSSRRESSDPAENPENPILACPRNPRCDDFLMQTRSKR